MDGDGNAVAPVAHVVIALLGVEVVMVENVEALGPELDIDLFVHRELLGDGRIQFPCAGATEAVALGGIGRVRPQLEMPPFWPRPDQLTTPANAGFAKLCAACRFPSR